MLEDAREAPYASAAGGSRGHHGVREVERAASGFQRQSGRESAADCGGGEGLGCRRNPRRSIPPSWMRRTTWQARRPGGRRAILILTDNLSMSYRLTDGQVIRELDKADTVFNAIVTGHAIRPNPPGPSMFPNRRARTDARQRVPSCRRDRRRVGEGGSRRSQTFSEMIQRIRSPLHAGAITRRSRTPGMFRHISVKLSPDAQKRYPSAEVHSAGHRGYYAQ